MSNKSEKKESKRGGLFKSLSSIASRKLGGLPRSQSSTAIQAPKSGGLARSRSGDLAESWGFDDSEAKKKVLDVLDFGHSDELSDVEEGDKAAEDHEAEAEVAPEAGADPKAPPALDLLSGAPPAVAISAQPVLDRKPSRPVAAADEKAPLKPLPIVKPPQHKSAIQNSYLAKQRELFIKSEAVYGIQAKFFYKEDKKGKERLWFERNATKAQPLRERTPPDKNILLIQYNSCFRTLGVVEGATHVLEGIAEAGSDRAAFHIHYLQNRYTRFEDEAKAALQKANKRPDGKKKITVGKWLLLAGVLTLISCLFLTKFIVTLLPAVIATAAVAAVCLVAGLYLFFKGIKEAKNKDILDRGNHAKLQKELTQLEESFNLDVLRCMKDYAFFHQIVEKPKEQVKFLSYCRYAAGSLDEAPIVETITKIPGRNDDYRVTCYPATVKTPAQKEKLKETISDDNLDTRRDFYSKSPPHLRAVTKAFREELLDDARGLSPQMRAYVPYGAREAFTVERRVHAADDPHKNIHLPHLWGARMGTPAYIGGGAKDDKVRVAAAAGNISQVRDNTEETISLFGSAEEAESEKCLAVKMLITDTGYRAGMGKLSDSKRQDLMVGDTKSAVEGYNDNPDEESTFKGKDQVDLFSTNLEGRFTPPRALVRPAPPEEEKELVEEQKKSLRNEVRLAKFLMLLGIVMVVFSPMWALLIMPPHSISLSALTTSALVNGVIGIGIGIAVMGVLLIILAGTFAKWGNPFNPRDRILLAVKEGLDAGMSGEQIMTILVNTCASGIDRTGVQELLTDVEFLVRTKQCTRKEALEMIVAGGHNAAMSHILCPGSPGMKSDSRPGGFFGWMGQFVFLKSAQANKDVPLLGSALKREKKSSSRWGLAVVGLLLIAPFLAIMISTSSWGSWANSVNLAIGGVGPALVFVLSTLVVFGILQRGIKKFVIKDDLGAAGVAALVTILIAAIFFPLAGMTAWTTLANVSLLTPIIMTALISLTILGAGWQMGNKMAASAVKSDFAEQVKESPSGIDKSVLNSFAAHPELAKNPDRVGAKGLAPADLDVGAPVDHNARVPQSPAYSVAGSVISGGDAAGSDDEQAPDNGWSP